MGLFVIVVIGISAGLIYAVMMGSLSLESFASPSQSSGAFMTGHVEAVIYDQAGHIVAYRQADNAIVQHGMAMLIDALFLNGSQASVCTVGPGNCHINTTITHLTYGKVGYMSIGNNTGGAAPAYNNRDLACPLETASIATCTGANGQQNTARAACTRVLSEIRNTTSTGVGAGPNAQINVTAIATFLGSNCNSIAIQEAGIWNRPSITATNDHMFARNTFGSVTLTSTDSLELTWKFTFTDT